MGQGYQSGSMTVANQITISGGVQTTPPVYGLTQTQVSYTSGRGAANLTANTAVTIHTVTATKTFYLCGYSIYTQAASMNWDLQDNATAKVCGGAQQIHNVSLSSPIPFTNTVKIIASATGGCFYTVWGFEQ